MENNMENKRYSTPWLIATILFAAYTVVRVFKFFKYLGHYRFEPFAAVVQVVLLVAMLAVTFALVFKCKGLVPESITSVVDEKIVNYCFVGGLALYALVNVFWFFCGFKDGSYDLTIYRYYSDDVEKFNLFCMLPDLVLTVGDVMIAFFAAVYCLPFEQLDSYKDKCKGIWFLPGAFVAGSTVLSILIKLYLDLFEYNKYWYRNPNLWSLVMGAVFILVALVLCYPDGIPKKVRESVQGGTGYISIVSHVLLLVFTFGVWYYIWIYRTTKYLNNLESEAKHNPTNKLLLCMFIPLYSVYWVYKSALRTDKLAAENGLESNITMPCLFTAAVVPILAPIIMQDKINEIALTNSIIGNHAADNFTVA